MSKDIKLSDLLSNYQYFIPSIFGFGIGFLAIGLSLYWIASGFSNRQELAALNRQISDFDSRIIRLEELERGGLDQLQSTVEGVLPDEKPVFSALSAISDIASESNIFVSNLQSRPGSVATGSARIVTNPKSNSKRQVKLFEELSVSLELEGNLATINDFLFELLSVAPLMQLKTVRVSSRPSIIDDSTVEISSSEIELEVYWMPAKENQKKISFNSRIEELTSDQIELLEQLEKLPVY